MLCISAKVFAVDVFLWLGLVVFGFRECEEYEGGQTVETNDVITCYFHRVNLLSTGLKYWGLHFGNISEKHRFVCHFRV